MSRQITCGKHFPIGSKHFFARRRGREATPDERPVEQDICTSRYQHAGENTAELELVKTSTVFYLWPGKLIFSLN